MQVNEKFSAIRKGLLEFLVLKIVAADKVYVADILGQLSGTEFATQEGTLYPLLSKMRREELVDYEWKESEAGRRGNITSSRPRAGTSFARRTIIGRRSAAP
jgi:PadR family transcriptional regulator, regulatory protein PadR